jgi:putative DNA primase/helicase
MITKLTGVAPVKGKCSQWLEFLEEATGGDLDMISFIKRWLGYSLTGHTREEQLAFFHGPGGNGKGTLITIASKLIGDYAVTAPMHIFLTSKNERHSTDLAMLKGARFVTAQENKAGTSWDEERLKALTGGDLVTARFMRQDNFTFMPQFSLTMSANNAPSLSQVDDAIRRRFNIIPFVHKPVSADKKLKERLFNREGPQILAWMVEGAVEWHREGLGEAEVIAKASEEYFGAQDVVGQWLEEECKRDRTSKEPVHKLYDAFVAYNRGDGRSMMSMKAFSKELVDKRGFGRMRTELGAFIVGIHLNSPDMR